MELLRVHKELEDKEAAQSTGLLQDSREGQLESGDPHPTTDCNPGNLKTTATFNWRHLPLIAIVLGICSLTACATIVTYRLCNRSNPIANDNNVPTIDPSACLEAYPTQHLESMEVELIYPFSPEAVHAALTGFPNVTKLTIDVDASCPCVQNYTKTLSPVSLPTVTHLLITNSKKCPINFLPFALNFTSLKYVLITQSNLSSINDLRQLLTPSLDTLIALDVTHSICSTDIKDLVFPRVNMDISDCPIP